MAEQKRPTIEYQARAVKSAAPIVKTREIAFLLAGEPSEEETDLVVRLPAGTIAALVIQLQAACAALDESVADRSIAAQPVPLTGAKAAMRIMGRPALVLSMGPLEVPVVLTSDETAGQIIDALEQAVQSKSGAPTN